MQNKSTVEVIVGLFLVLGFAAFVYISMQFGEFSPFAMAKQYPLKAEFTNVSGLKQGAVVEIAGVDVGRVAAIRLAGEDRAVVTMMVDNTVHITEDAIAAIRTQGIIGDKYIKILQGGADDYLQGGDLITETESAIDLEEMISKYIFGKI